MTTQAQHSYDQALADKDTAIKAAQALAGHWQAVADEQRAWIDAQPDWKRIAEARRAELAALIEDARALSASYKDISRQLTTIRDERDGLMSQLGEACQGLTVGEENSNSLIKLQ